MTLKKIENTIPHVYKIYDADKKLLLATCNGSGEAASFLGCPAANIHPYAKSRSVMKPDKNKLGLRIAIRG